MNKILIFFILLMFVSCEKDDHIIPKQSFTETSIKEIKKPKKKLGFFKTIKSKRIFKKKIKITNNN